MNERLKLDTWLRARANQLIARANSRRSYAEAGNNLTPDDMKAAHRIAEQMMGRKLPCQTAAQRKKSAEMEQHIASKLEAEAAMLNEFADEFTRIESQLLAYRDSGALEALNLIADHPGSGGCDCDHLSDECCAVTGPDFYCLECIAGRAIAKLKALNA